MMNGPLGGNMATPAAPAQPPQVNFTTTAESRGGFNNFLKSIPNTTAMTPLPPMGSSPTMPMANPMGNIDIFNQPMGMMGMNQPQMNPMMQQPMQPPMMNQQPMMMAGGGGVPPRQTEIMGQPHMLSYITPEEGGILKALGGAGRPGPMGIPSFFDAGDFDGGGFDGSSYSDNNDDNNDFSFSDDVGVGNAGDFTVGDTEDRSQSDAYQSALDNITLGSDDKAFEDDSAFRGVNVGLENTGGFTTGVLPGSRGERFARFYNPNYALRGIGRDFQTKIGNNPNLTAGDYFENFTPTSENPGGTGNRMAEFTTATGKGPNDILSLNDMNNIMDIQGKYEAGIRNNPAGQIEKISTTVPMDNSKDVANVLANLDLSKDLALEPSVQYDAFGNVIGSTPPNDPSAGLRNVADVLKGGESLTYDPVQNKISFSSADDNRSRSQDRNIDQVPYETLNRGLDTFDSVRAGLNFDDPKVKDTTDIFSPSASDFANFQATRDQLPNVDVFENIIDRNFTRSLPGANLPTIGSARSTIADDQAKALANLVGGSPPLTDVEKGVQQNQEDLMAQRGRALGPTTFSDDLQNFQANVRGQTPTETSRVGDDFAPALDIVDARQEARQEARQKALAERDANVRDMDNIDRSSAGRASDFPTLSTLTRPEDYEENVGRRFDPDRMADIERLYNLSVGQGGKGTGKDPNFIDSSKGTEPTFLENLGIPSILTALDPEKRSRELMATEIALGRPMGLGETFFGFNAPSMFVNDKGVGLVSNREGDKLVPNFRGTPGMTMEEYMANTQKNVLNEAGDSETVSRRLPENQLIRNDSGRVIGIRDANGRLVSGMDPNAPIDRGDDNDNNPFIRRLPLVKTVADVEEDKTPNVFGGAGSIAPITPKSVVVDSPFTTNVGDYSPTGFDSGDLNALIARLLKTSNPKSMAQGGVAEYAGGGLISAVDNFLASV